MKFTPEEARERTLWLKAAHSELIDGLKQPTFQRELGEKALELLNIANELYVPTVRDGVVSIPRRYRGRSTATPIIVVEPGEEYVIDRSLAVMSGRQSHQYMGFLADRVEDDLSRNTIKREADTINKRLAKAGPFHELNHVSRTETNPVSPLGELEHHAEYWSQEDECYKLSVQYGTALAKAGNNKYYSSSSFLNAKTVVETMASLSGGNPNPKPTHMTPGMIDFMGQIGYET